MKRKLLGLPALLIACMTGSASAQMPDTGTFMAMLTACASGASTEFDADLIGSIEDLYNGQRTEGFAKLKTQTDFLSLLPEKDKLEGYRLYTECIKSIVVDPRGSRAEAQREFLDGFDFSTTLDKVREVFGAVSKSRDGYLWFEGAEVSFFVHQDSGGNIDRVAVYAGEKRDKARIPMLNMGNQVAGKVLEFYHLGDFRFSYMSELCQTETIGIGHARFAFKVTEPCYFGKPGGYANYVFVFQPDFSEENCNDDFIDGQKYADFTCKTSRDMTPVLALVYPEDVDFPAMEDANALMEWIYRF